MSNPGIEVFVWLRYIFLITNYERHFIFHTSEWEYIDMSDLG